MNIEFEQNVIIPPATIGGTITVMRRCDIPAVRLACTDKKGSDRIAIGQIDQKIYDEIVNLPVQETVLGPRPAA
ncbi:hypothetical protein N7520_005815 [Penicillium odoratum]|uniref:uncharacterized protein n=1 Tax=Penicillium odoratum TaxID=1167516 RepID=UPI002548AE6B|nr:uncharacterized protein N7520_005815 [Penicillium odoratum]KAJ5758659.1 hypothetical protein N7520_005815 [Penicillium odoratum]